MGKENGADTDAVMFGNRLDMFVRILESDGGIKGNLFALDDIYEQIYFIPLIKVAQIQVRLLMNPVYVCYDLELWSLKRVRGKIEREGRRSCCERDCKGEGHTILGRR